jgi:vacuolar-type H+-ATPase catalytic subunit A/Vma1
MATVKELKAECKAKGIKGITGKKKAELEAMLAKHGGEKNENDAFFDDAYKKLGKTPKPKKTFGNMDKFLANAEKKLKTKKEKMPYIAKLPKMTKNGKKMSDTPIDKQISDPKKISGSMQEELAKAGLRGGLKKKYKV